MDNSGASAAQTGLSPSVEPVPVSPADAASIPSAEDMVRHAKSDHAYATGLRSYMDAGGQISDQNIADLIAMVEWGSRSLADAYGGDAS